MSYALAKVYHLPFFFVWANEISSAHVRAHEDIYPLQIGNKSIKSLSESERQSQIWKSGIECLQRLLSRNKVFWTVCWPTVYSPFGRIFLRFIATKDTTLAISKRQETSKVQRLDI